MSNTPKTDKLFFPFGRDHTAAHFPSFLECVTQCELLEKENAAQLAELTRISEALGTNEGHSSVTHIEILKKENAALREQNRWLLHELKTAANRLTDCQQTTISARDCIGRLEAAMKEEGK